MKSWLKHLLERCLNWARLLNGIDLLQLRQMYLPLLASPGGVKSKCSVPPRASMNVSIVSACVSETRNVRL